MPAVARAQGLLPIHRRPRPTAAPGGLEGDVLIERLNRLSARAPRLSTGSSSAGAT